MASPSVSTRTHAAKLPDASSTKPADHSLPSPSLDIRPSTSRRKQNKSADQPITLPPSESALGPPVVLSLAASDDGPPDASQPRPLAGLPLRTNTPHSGSRSPAIKRETMRSAHLSQLLSPSSARKSLPSPPTSTPSFPSPVNSRKRKSVNFNDKVLQSARSVPNHRSRRRTTGGASHRAGAQSNAPLQPPLFSASSRASADRHKRARLSLAVPQTTRPTVQTTRPTPSDASSDKEQDPSRVETINSPLTAKSTHSEKLARFYFTPPPAADVPARPESPTLSTSLGTKRYKQSLALTLQMLADADDSDSVSSDETTASEHAIAMALLPRNPSLSTQSAGMHSSNPNGDMRRTASCSQFEDLRGLQRPGAVSDDPDELRPILKKTDAKIMLAESVEQATRTNGRPKLSLDPPAPLVHRRVIAAVTSKALKQSVNQRSGPAASGVTTEGEAQATACSSGPSDQAKSSPKDLRVQHNQRGPRRSSDSNQSDDDLPPSSNADDSAAADFAGPSADTTEECLLASVRSCLATLQASLLPPPGEMRLDPVSPLATLTSPQKRKVGQLGNLVGSPREPRDVLPRALAQVPRIEPSAGPKAQLRTRGRPSGGGARSWTKSIDTKPASSDLPVIQGPLRTPEQSPKRLAQARPRVAITLREVEDTYISLHDHLDALLHHWKETKQICAADQQTRAASMFTEDLGCGLMKCLVREVDNLCRLDPAGLDQPSNPSTSKQATTSQRDDLSRMMPSLNTLSSFEHQAPTNRSAASSLRDDLSRMMPNSNQQPPNSKLASLRSHSSPSLSVKEKSGSSTNQMRRRVAEIETGQAALKCIALLWSSPCCMANFDDSYTQRLLSLLIKISHSTILRRKKNLTAIGLHNYIFKSQNLTRAMLEPHCSSIVDSVASTLYLSAGKSGDKGQKVLSLGLAALQQLTTQMPQSMSQKIGKFLEPLLASLTATDSPVLRHHAMKGLGALINCTDLDWEPSSPRTSARALNDEAKLSAEELFQAQEAKKDAFKEKLSASTLAFLNDKNTFTRWHLLNKQLLISLNQGDVGWVISVMATTIALLGKRIRRLDPPLTRSFMPFIKVLLQSNTAARHLAQQLWDYYIRVMLIWSADSIETNHRDKVWALDKVQLPFFMQTFRNSYFFSPTEHVPPANGSLTQNQNGTFSGTGKLTGNPEAYDGLLKPNKSTSPGTTEAQSNRIQSPLAADLPSLKTVLLHGRQLKAQADYQQSTHHHSVSAFLYGILGFVQQHLHIPTPLQALGPNEWLESVSNSPRLRHLDIVWDEIVNPLLPNILTGPVDDHRMYACEILVALCGRGSMDQSLAGDGKRWSLERYLHHVYHDPPLKQNSVSEVCLNEFSKAAIGSAVKPVEIPGMDPLWICLRSRKVLAMVGCCLSSMKYIVSPDNYEWVTGREAKLGGAKETRVIPVVTSRVWTAVVKALNFTFKRWGDVLDSKFSKSFRDLIYALEQTVGYDQPTGPRSSSESGGKTYSIELFEHLYTILKQEMGEELMSRPLIEVMMGEEGEKENMKISGLSKLAAFLLTSTAATSNAGSAGSDEWTQFGLLVDAVLGDLIAGKKVSGSPERLCALAEELSRLAQTCKHERLVLLLGKTSMKTVIELVKNVETGVSFDEPPIQPCGVVMTDVCLRAVKSEATVDRALHADFIDAVIRLVGRASGASLQSILSGCRLSLRSYLADDQILDRDRLYKTLLTSLKSVDDYEGVMSRSAMSDLIVSPFQNGPGQPALSVCSTAFLNLMEHAPVKAYVGEEEAVARMIEALKVTPLTVSPAVIVKKVETSLLSPLQKGPLTDCQSTYSTLDEQSQVRKKGSKNELNQSNNTCHEQYVAPSEVLLSPLLQMKPKPNKLRASPIELLRLTRAQSRRSLGQPLTPQSESRSRLSGLESPVRIEPPAPSRSENHTDSSGSVEEPISNEATEAARVDASVPEVPSQSAVDQHDLSSEVVESAHQSLIQNPIEEQVVAVDTEVSQPEETSASEVSKVLCELEAVVPADPVASISPASSQETEAASQTTSSSELAKKPKRLRLRLRDPPVETTSAEASNTQVEPPTAAQTGPNSEAASEAAEPVEVEPGKQVQQCDESPTEAVADPVPDEPVTGPKDPLSTREENSVCSSISGAEKSSRRRSTPSARKTRSRSRRSCTASQEQPKSSENSINSSPVKDAVAEASEAGSVEAPKTITPRRLKLYIGSDRRAGLSQSPARTDGGSERGADGVNGTPPNQEDPRRQALVKSGLQTGLAAAQSTPVSQANVAIGDSPDNPIDLSAPESGQTLEHETLPEQANASSSNKEVVDGSDLMSDLSLGQRPLAQDAQAVDQGMQRIEEVAQSNQIREKATSCVVAKTALVPEEQPVFDQLPAQNRGLEVDGANVTPASEEDLNAKEMRLHGQSKSQESQTQSQVVKSNVVSLTNNHGNVKQTRKVLPIPTGGLLSSIASRPQTQHHDSQLDDQDDVSLRRGRSTLCRSLGPFVDPLLRSVKTVASSFGGRSIHDQSSLKSTSSLLKEGDRMENASSNFGTPRPRGSLVNSMVDPVLEESRKSAMPSSGLVLVFFPPSLDRVELVIDPRLRTFGVGQKLVAAPPARVSRQMESRSGDSVSAIEPSLIEQCKVNSSGSSVQAVNAIGKSSLGPAQNQGTCTEARQGDFPLEGDTGPSNQSPHQSRSSPSSCRPASAQSSRACFHTDVGPEGRRKHSGSSVWQVLNSKTGLSLETAIDDRQARHGKSHDPQFSQRAQDMVQSLSTRNQRRLSKSAVDVDGHSRAGLPQVVIGTCPKSSNSAGHVPVPNSRASKRKRPRSTSTSENASALTESSKSCQSNQLPGRQNSACCDVVGSTSDCTSHECSGGGPARKKVNFGPRLVRSMETEEGSVESGAPAECAESSVIDPAISGTTSRPTLKSSVKSHSCDWIRVVVPPSPPKRRSTRSSQHQSTRSQEIQRCSEPEVIVLGDSTQEVEEQLELVSTSQLARCARGVMNQLTDRTLRGRRGSGQGLSGERMSN